jgi:hypothetical protein
MWLALNDLVFHVHSQDYCDQHYVNIENFCKQLPAMHAQHSCKSAYVGSIAPPAVCDHGILVFQAVSTPNRDLHRAAQLKSEDGLHDMDTFYGA